MMTIDHSNPSERDKLAITVAKFAVLHSFREEDDDRSRNEFIADGLIEEGLVNVES